MKKELSQILTRSIDRMVAYIRNHYDNPEKVLREKQMNVFEAVLNFFQKGISTGYIKLPTGTGKTVLFGQIIRAMANEKSKALIIVPRVQLVDQTYESLGRFAPELTLGRINQHYKEYGNQVTITTYTSWKIQLLSGNMSLSDFDLVILDEGHRALTPKIQPLVESAKEVSIVLGFSATPGFSEMKHLKELLDREIYTMELPEAIAIGLLCGVRVMLAEIDIDLSKTASVRGDYDAKDLEKLINTKKVNNAALEIYQKYFNGECAIVYANSIQHIADVVSIFAGAGIETRGIHGKTPEKLKEKILKDYRNGKFDVLVNCDLLIEGFDETRASVCLNLRPTQSLVLAEQRGGRVLRLNPMNEEKIACIVDFLYKESPKREKSILFSMITGGALVLPESFNTSQNLRSGIFRSPKDISDIKGARVIYDLYEIDELTKNTLEHNAKISLPKLNLSELAKEVRELGIFTSTQYFQLQKTRSRWPAEPNYYYNDWISWEDFLQRYLSFEQLQKELKELGVSNQESYRSEAKKRPNWPSVPVQYYADSIKNWHELFGRKKPEYISLEELRIQVKKLDITGIYQYREIWKDHDDWPANPDVYYRQHGNVWISYPDLFGKNSIQHLNSLDDLKKAVKAAGIQSISQYHANRKPEWPSDPKIYEGWISYMDLFGKTEVEYLSYETVQKEVQAQKIKNHKEYQRVRKKNPQWPSQPEKIYENDWNGWVDFFGKRRQIEHNFLSYEDLKSAVQKALITSSTAYRAVKNLYEGWPAHPDSYYDEWVDWPTFLGKRQGGKGK